jgi:cardiolipin synthase
VLWYLVALFVVKEGFQLIAGGINFRKGIMLKGALITGKICTTVLFLSLILMVLMPDLSDQAILWIVVVDIVFMLISFTDYVLTYLKKESRFQAIDAENNK